MERLKKGEKPTWLKSRGLQIDQLVNLTIVGDSTVGKSSLLRRFVDNDFSPEHKETIGVEFKVKYIDIDGIRTKFLVWDTGGHEKFRYIVLQYLRGAHVLLVFDVNNRESFAHLEHWKDSILQNAYKPFLLLGNKTDVDPQQRVVSYEEAQNWADQNQIKYFEVSAKTSNNVEKSFFDLTREALKQKGAKPTGYPKTFPSERVLRYFAGLPAEEKNLRRCSLQ